MLRYNPEALFNISCSNWNYSSTANLSTVSCSEWWYNRTIFTSTVIMDFNLVCNNLWKQELSQFLLMFGILVGATMCGICSDKYVTFFLNVFLKQIFICSLNQGVINLTAIAVHFVSYWWVSGLYNYVLWKKTCWITNKKSSPPL